MAQPQPPEPVMLICGILAGRQAWLDEAVALIAERLGPTDLVSDTFPFNFTDYYEPQMGPNLLRRFVSLQDLIDPGRLADIKRLTNQLEGLVTGEVPRPINLDPGTLNGSQLVLASTKPYAHRIYLRDGVYAEVTLLWSAKGRGGWVPMPWTYPDYAGPTYHAFLTAARTRFLEKRRAARAEETSRR